MKGASVGSGDAALDHDLVVWFGDFHSSIAGFEPVSFGSDWQFVNGLEVLSGRVPAVEFTEILF